MTAQPPPYGPYGPPQHWDPQPQPYPRREVTHSRKRTSHGLHLFLTIITFGAWGLLVWLPLSLWHRFGPKRKTITRYS